VFGKPQTHTKQNTLTHTHARTHPRAGLVVTETIIASLFVDHRNLRCSVVACGTDRNRDDLVVTIALSLRWESSLLVSFLAVLIVRLLFLIGEHAVLLRVIAHYQRATTVRLAPSGECAPETISFKREIRELFRGDSTWSTSILLVSIFVQVNFWFSGQYGRYRLWREIEG
jgi:hypothetical protein